MDETFIDMMKSLLTLFSWNNGIVVMWNKCP